MMARAIIVKPIRILASPKFVEFSISEQRRRKSRIVSSSHHEVRVKKDSCAGPPRAWWYLPPAMSLPLTLRRYPARRRAALLLLALHVTVASGCTTWSRVASPGLPDPAPSTVQVWAHDSGTVLRRPVVRGDSLIGTTPRDKAGGEGQVLARSMADVDSLRVHKVSASRTALAAVALLGSIFFVSIISWGFYGEGN